MAIPNHKAAEINIAIQPAPINVRVNSFSFRDSATLSRAERLEFSTSPDIKNNGQSLFVFGDNKLNDPYATEDEKQRERNERDGKGAVTDVEEFRADECRFYEDTYDYDYDTMFDDNGYYKLPYPDSYVEMLESGEMVDDGFSCKMGKANLGNSFTAEDLDAADAELAASSASEMDQEEPAALTAEAESDDPDDDIAADGPKVKGSKRIQPEGKASSNTASSDFEDAEPAIASDINLTNKFASASAPKKDAPPELAVAPQPVAPSPMAVNQQSFQMSA